MKEHAGRSGQAPPLEERDGDDAAGHEGGDAGAGDDVTEALLALLAVPSEGEAAAEAERGPPTRIEGVVVGTLVELADRPIVTWPGARGPVPARALASIASTHVGGEVALMFELGDPERPLVMGPIQSMLKARPAVTEESVEVEAIADGERVLLQAERELVLRCGKASITLTRAGKILIRGAYVSSHADGAQRIRGGTVEIN